MNTVSTPLSQGITQPAEAYATVAFGALWRRISLAGIVGT